MDKNNFEFWLKSHTKLSDSTVKKYGAAINSISDDMKNHNFSIDSLYNINDPILIESFRESYFSIDEFKEKDLRGNRMYSNALKYYKRYVEQV